MLVISRKVNEEIKIGNDILIKIVSIKNKDVRLGIDAPKNIRVNRPESNFSPRVICKFKLKIANEWAEYISDQIKSTIDGAIVILKDEFLEVHQSEIIDETSLKYFIRGIACTLTAKFEVIQELTR